MDERALKKVVIDAGHGGSDPGTSGNGITEKDYTLKISQYMNQRLKDLGIESSMTRTTDETLDPSKRPIRAQSFYGNDDDVILISNHINAGGGQGAEVIYSLRNNDRLSSMIAKELQNAGQNVRKYYQRRLPSNPSKDYYYILRDTPDNESLIVEYGFADNTTDANLIKSDYEGLTEAVVKALADYIGVNYVPPMGSNMYKVVAGDTLWGLAKKFGVSVDELKSANNLASNSLSIGQVLRIPGLSDNGLGDTSLYTVQAGDSLYAIANKFGTTVDELKRINNLTSNNLSIGQKLKVKEDTTGNVTNDNVYVVQAGDSLYAIANKFGTTVDELKRINNLTSNNLSIGQKLIIREGNSSQVIEGNTYVVKAGDSLYSIARNFNTTVDAIKNLNNLTSSLLSVGQILKIPSESSSNENFVYTVSKGDNLYQIARTYNTTVTELLKLNNLASSNLSVGQKLLIPN